MRFLYAISGMNLVNPSPSNSVNTTPIKFTDNHVLSDQSPTSDFVDDSSLSTTPESSNSSLHSPIPTLNHTQRSKHPHNIPYNPLVHVTSKPPYSFSCLIFMAIEDSLQKALPVKEIYMWIMEHFPYFRNAATGWKNSVRHNLSLNKCFQKVEKAPVSRGGLPVSGFSYAVCFRTWARDRCGPSTSSTGRIWFKRSRGHPSTRAPRSIRALFIQAKLVRFRRRARSTGFSIPNCFRTCRTR